MGTVAKPTPDAVPLVGEQVSFTIDPGYWAPRQYPPADQTPWTHGGPPPAGRRTDAGAATVTEPSENSPAAEAERVSAAVLSGISTPGQRGIIVDSPPGAGKSTLVVRAATSLASAGERCIIVAQTNNQVDDLTARLAEGDPQLPLGRLTPNGLQRLARRARAARRPGLRQDRSARSRRR